MGGDIPKIKLTLCTAELWVWEHINNKDTHFTTTTTPTSMPRRSKKVATFNYSDTLVARGNKIQVVGARGKKEWVRKSDVPDYLLESGWAADQEEKQIPVDKWKDYNESVINSLRYDNPAVLVHNVWRTRRELGEDLFNMMVSTGKSDAAVNAMYDADQERTQSDESPSEESPSEEGAYVQSVEY